MMTNPMPAFMDSIMRILFAAAFVFAAVLPAHAQHHAASTQDAPCRTSGPFEPWLAKVKQEAMAAGVSQRTLAAAAPYLVYSQDIVNRDRGQRVFGQAFVEFSDRMAAAYRMQQGQAKIKAHANAFARAEQQYGVPAPVIAAFWGLESDFGANMGKLSTLTSLASLAYDCRRAAMFREELISALKVVERGDLQPGEMIGSWAGELGQTQFLATLYEKFAVDGDGDGRRDLLRSPADVILSTANYIASLGWKRGEPWLTEVRVSANVPWEQSDLTIQHPRSQWAKWGVTLADGRPLPNDALPASLLLPMGRQGPAFLAYNNFKIYTTWNNSLIYATTAAYLATSIGGTPALRRPATPVPQLAFNELKELQQHLAQRGFNVGKIDGILGQQSRVAVKAMQVKFGLPADAWPTAELLARLRSGAR
jgi:lytic murein transglycosylase